VQHNGSALARDWLGEDALMMLFHWHFQTFELPAQAQLLARSAACRHQAFALGPHLGMQFHVEVDAAKLARWCQEAPAPGSPLAALPSVQTPERMRADTWAHLEASQRLATRLYDRWLALARARLVLGRLTARA
jgi:GMP synthase-like glutamine amidotransferase